MGWPNDFGIRCGTPNSRLATQMRTVRETLALSETDIETATALMSARLIVGDASLFEELVSGFEGQRAERGKQWLRKLAASAAERGDAAGDVAHELEPDIKEGNGGLRSAPIRSTGLRPSVWRLSPPIANDLRPRTNCSWPFGSNCTG